MSRFPRPEEQFPRLGAEPERPRSRGHVVRMALFYTIWTLLSLSLVGLALGMIFGKGDTGFLVMLFVFGIFGFLVGYHANHFLRDLKAQTVAREGSILRKWHKGNLLIFFFPSYYIMVGDHIYSVKRDEYAMLLEDDLVRITCFPHSLTVERVERYDNNEKQFVPATSGATGH
jgi:hypothetical protein